MLDILTDAVSAITYGLYYTLLISYKTGQFIVFMAKTSIIVGGELFTLLLTITKVVLEDFTYFIRDVLAGIQTCVTFLSGVINNMCNALSNFTANVFAISENIYSLMAGFFVGVVTTARNILTSIQHIMVMIKRIIVLFGSGIWFALTLIPVSIAYFCTTVTYYFGRLFDELFEMCVSIVRKFTSSFREVYMFVTDVPVESIAGLFAAVCILYLFTQFHVMLIRVLYLLSRPLYIYTSDVIITGGQRLRTVTRQISQWLMGCLRLRSRDCEEEPLNPNLQPSTSGDSHYCVICQEHFKCVLTLPCRHVCMCGGCYTEMRQSNIRTCPLCRMYIEKHMKVYI